MCEQSHGSNFPPCVSPKPFSLFMQLYKTKTSHSWAWQTPTAGQLLPHTDSQFAFHHYILFWTEGFPFVSMPYKRHLEIFLFCVLVMMSSYPLGWGFKK